MGKTWAWAGNLLALMGVMAVGFWLGVGRTVKASSYDSGGLGVQFQLTGVNESSVLLVYQPDTRTVYVYQGCDFGKRKCAVHVQVSNDASRRSASSRSLRGAATKSLT